MPTYLFRCSGCDKVIEHATPGTNEEIRHLVDERGEVCGVLRRDYRAENAGLLRENIRAVPREG